MESTKEEGFVKILITLWSIWWARRKAINEKEFQSPLSIFSSIQKYIADLALVPNWTPTRAPETSSRSAGGVHTLRTWSPPQQGYMKLMVDAAISRHGNRGAVAVVCRGAQGIYQGSSAVIFQDMVQPECLEAMAVSEALALASDLYIDKILVATDCMSTVNHLKGQYLGPNAAIIHDIKEKSLQVLKLSMLGEKRIGKLTILLSLLVPSKWGAMCGSLLPRTFCRVYATDRKSVV